MKILPLQIKKCSECPSNVLSFSYRYCNASRARRGVSRMIENMNTLPDWCPLPDIPRFLTEPKSEGSATPSETIFDNIAANRIMAIY